MRFRFPLFALLFIAGSLAIPHLVHAGIPFWGPIIDTSWTVPNTITGGVTSCALGWGAFMTVINHIIELLITLAIIFVAPLMIAYSGFKFVISGENPGLREDAKTILWSTIKGIVVALAAWMIVDAVMAVLYNPDGALGTWSSLVGSSGLECLPQQGVGTGLNPTTVSPPGLGVGGPQIGTAPGPCADGNSACSTSAIKSGAAALNMTLNDTQATIMSCIAMTESAGNPNTPDSNTGACGTFQITNKTSASNWQNPAFHQSPCSTSSSCNDAQCNMQTALIMFKQRGYQPWTGKNPDGTYWNPNAVACVQTYGG